MIRMALGCLPGYLRIIREVTPHMTKRGGGRIINISGLAARHTGTTIGSIRNVGVAALTKIRADELGPHAHREDRRYDRTGG